MKPIRVGIVGLGMMGITHFGIFRKHPRARVVAVADERPERRKGNWGAIAGNIGGRGGRVDLSGLSVYADADELIADPRVDAVSIALPTPLHVRHVTAALKAGKYVLCEKPLAATLAECDAALAAERRAPGRLMVAMCMRFWPEWRWLKDTVVDRRAFGRVLSATFQRHSATPAWSAGGWMKKPFASGAAAMDLHIHDADFVQYMFGPVRSVISRGIRGKVTRGGWDYLDTLYDVKGVPHVRAEGGNAYESGWDFWWEYKVQCERATVYHTIRPEPVTRVYHPDGRVKNVRLPRRPFQENGWAAEIDYFLACIQKRKPFDLVTPLDARNAVALVLAEIKSAERSGRPVRPSLRR